MQTDEQKQWERDRLQLWLPVVRCKLHDDAKAYLPEEYAYLYGFCMPKLCRQLPHLVAPDWAMFGAQYGDGRQREYRHEFEPEMVRCHQRLEAYKELLCGPDEANDENEEWTEERVIEIYERTMEKIRTNPVFAEMFEEISQLLKKAIDED
jgi:hypothetical protein